MKIPMINIKEEERIWKIIILERKITKTISKYKLSI